MIKTLLHFRNADSTQDINTQLAGFFAKGVVSGGTIAPVTPNSVPQITVAPFKLIGQDGMVVLETSDTQTFTLPANTVTVVCFNSQYITNANPVATFQMIEISAYNALGAGGQAPLTVFGVVTTTGATVAPVVDYSLANLIDPVGRNTLRGLVAAVANLPASNNRVGDAYVVESGTPDSNNGIYVWKGTAGWTNITDTLALSTLLTNHLSDLTPNERHLTDAQKDAVDNASPAPSASNPFLTADNALIPTAEETAALEGLSNAVPVPPSAINPYVTAAYNEAQPAAYNTTASGSFITLSPAQGPFYVGLGVGNASALPYFRLYDAVNEREYTNSAGDPVYLTGVYKSTLGPTPLDPSVETTVTNSNGFWSSSIYFTFSGVIDSAVQIRYGVLTNFSTASRGLALLPGPREAQMSGPLLARLKAISGRQFDDPMQAGESNVQLFNALGGARRYLNAATVGDYVVSGDLFPKMREAGYTEFNVQGNYQILLSGTHPYTVGYTPSAIAAFDSVFVQDASYVSVITYSPSVSLTNVMQGMYFLDDAGYISRILQVNVSASKLLIFTNGRPVNGNNTGGQTSVLVAGNNPLNLEIYDEHRTWMFGDLIPVEGVAAQTNSYEFLPEGGSEVGTYVPVSNWSAIGQSILPNSGNAAGTIRGRPLFNVLPKANGDRFDPRVSLVGGWENDPAFPNAATGIVSQGALGIDITGRFDNITLLTRVATTTPYGFRVFINGVYNNAASQFLADQTLNSQQPSNALASLRGAEILMQPIHFSLNGALAGLNAQSSHVRIEITEGAGKFVLAGIRMNTAAQSIVEDPGNLFTDSDFVSTPTSNPLVAPTTWGSQARGAKVTHFIDKTTHARGTAIALPPTLNDPAVSIGAAATTFSSILLGASIQVGSVLILTTRTGSSQADVANTYHHRYVTDFDRSTNLITINAAIPTAGTYRVELTMSIPTDASGNPIVGSPGLIAPGLGGTEQEIARLKTQDWSTGTSSRDVANLSTVLSDSRVTTLDDGSTSISVHNCIYVTAGIAGYVDGIQMSTTTSSIIYTAQCARMDVVFSGSAGGTPTTVQVQIDGGLAYTITVSCTGVAHHSLFFGGNNQSHTVKISNPSIAGQIVISEVIFCDLAPALVTGTPVAEYSVMKNSVAGISGTLYDFYPTAGTQDPLLISNTGVRMVDLTKSHAALYNGSGGSTDWTIVPDFVNTPRFGYYMQTDRTNGFMNVVTTGSHFELYFYAGPDAGQVQIEVDGLVATSLNYPNQVFSSGVYNTTTGYLDCYAAASTWKRVVFQNFGFGTHVVNFTVLGTKNGSSSGFFFRPAQWAEMNGSSSLYVNQSTGRLVTSAFKDIRPLNTLLPAQLGGVVGDGSGDEAAEVSPSGYINAAFAMADGSGAPVNCTISLVGGVTVMDLTFPFVAGLNAGTTVGDLDVLVDGQVIPRKLSGVTQDANYQESTTISGRLVFWANLNVPGYPMSIEVRRKNGTSDQSALNTTKLATYMGNKIVGTAAQVTAGIANYSSLQNAINDSVLDEHIEVLNVAITENVTIPLRMHIHGRGFASQIIGTVTFVNTVQHALIEGLQVSQFILPLGASKNQIVHSFWTTAASDGNPANSNLISGLAV